ncbi:MAG: hypothetical protein IKZ13_02870 [Akkermansia sp.]|nr:hypothetical protein [Akkermansia sp.]
MARIMKRGGMWYAVYKVNGRTVQKSLKIAVEKGAAVCPQAGGCTIRRAHPSAPNLPCLFVYLFFSFPAPLGA